MLDPVSLTRDLDRVFPHCGFRLHTFLVLIQYEQDLSPGSDPPSNKATWSMPGLEVGSMHG